MAIEILRMGHGATIEYTIVHIGMKSPSPQVGTDGRSSRNPHPLEAKPRHEKDNGIEHIDRTKGKGTIGKANSFVGPPSSEDLLAHRPAEKKLGFWGRELKRNKSG